MAKKKATMTLKDFHGGSIPSDLPLPSAPGVTVRPMERAGQWGLPLGRQDHRLRPGSAGSVKNSFDDKSPFLGPNSHIGRNFDEDERKPLDGGSGPRRAVSDNSIRALPIRAEVAKPSFTQPPVQQFSAVPNSYAGRVSVTAHAGTGSKFGMNGGGSDSGSYPNAWAMRKEAVSVAEQAPVSWSGPDAASKLAHASALDKVSSGRWQSNKQPIQHPENVEPIRHGEVEGNYYVADVAGGVEWQDATLPMHVERNLAVNEVVRGGGKEIPSHGKTRSPMYPDKVENISHTSKSVGSITPSLSPPEQLARPKLKLLPRSKPLDSSEPPIGHNQGYHQPQNSDHVRKVIVPHEPAKHTKSGFTVADSGNLAVDRPKLSLKPRAQALEQAEEAAEKGRKAVFGSARPRELVLKERGVDDIVVNNHDVVQPPCRVKQDLTRNGAGLPHVMFNRNNGKPEGAPPNNRTGKNNDRCDNRVDAERTDMQKRNWRNENQRSSRENGNKHLPHHQAAHERPPSPETWRKPVEEPRPTSSDGTGLRYGKAASAVELAQAFSKSVSDPKAADRFPNQRGIPRSGQIPFSRLTEPAASRPRINGY